MTDPNKAVFLSYASQDADAARRICEALRSGGVEVWLDQEGGLVGGDAWDQKIRRQIRECALFVPIISANTQARLEGYFRLEWKLAEDRSHLMAKGKPFIVPVVVDGTTERDAQVPDSFLAVQWIRLPSGEPTPAFVEQVRSLLGNAKASATPAVGAPLDGARGREEKSHGFPGRRPATPLRRFPVWIWGMVGIIAVALGVWAFQSRIQIVDSKPHQSSVGSAKGETPNAEPKELAAAKSLAVLPFVNLSDDRENEHFADGLTEELGGVLARMAGLNVTARTSVFFFKGKNVPSREIGEKLGVAYLVEGSVRKSGSRVRITAQLIRAADGFRLWTDNFDREISEGFAVQDEIANLIAKKISPQLRAAADTARLAMSPENYRLFRRAVTLAQSADGEGAQQCIREALAVDENNPRAWAWASQIYNRMAQYGLLPAAAGYEPARDAGRKALALDPNLPEGHAALAGVYLFADWNWAEADKSARRAIALASSNGDLALGMARIARTVGRAEDALRLAREAVKLDPLNSAAQIELAGILEELDRVTEAEAQLRHVIELDGNPWNQVAFRIWLRQDRNEETDGWVQWAEASFYVWQRVYRLALIRHKQGRSADSQMALDDLIANHRQVSAYQVAAVYAFRGESDAAFQWLDIAHRQRDTGLFWIRRESEFKRLHSDARWPAFLKKLGLVDNQLK